MIGVVALVGGRYIYGVATKVDDKTQIKEALAEAIKASKEGRPGSVIDKLSENFKVNEESPGSSQIAGFVKNHHPEVDIKDTDPIVSSDTAQINSDITVKLDLMPGGWNFKDAQIQFKKEAAMDWWIFPTSKWHLSAVRVRPEDMPNLTAP
jgi:hypothetical protein